MEQLDKFNTAKQELFDYFGYAEDWVTIPLDDRRDMYWQLNQRDTGGGGDLLYYDERLTNQIVEDGAHYSNTIYTQRFLSKWVYRGEDYTMICVDTHTDGNKYLAIFSNDKEQTDITSEFDWKVKA